jgi:UDP-2,4-diacetamido-2,4,6-trideoxy-beta-L-altropyranose hydrolase
MQNSILKNEKRIFIRCATKPFFGLGHFKRCLTLAKELKNYHYNIIFLIHKNPFVIDELKKNNFCYKIIKNNFSLKEESSFISKYVNEFDIVIVDIKNFSEKLTHKLKNNKINTLLIDDAWTKNAYSNLVVNPTGIKKYHKYKKIYKNTKIFSGLDYYLIENEFIKNRKKIASIIKKKKYDVIISIGGSDINGVTLQIVNSILFLKNIKIKIIAGPFAYHLKKLKRLEQCHSNIVLIQNTNKIWKEFKKADLVLSNSGNTLHELVAQNIPSIYIAADEHQIPYGEFFARKHFGIFLGLWKDLDQNIIRNSVITFLENKSVRIKSVSSTKNIIDGKGTQRISKIIDLFLKN